MAKSYGPAGIFSTDDAVADQRQIDAENFVEEFDDDGHGDDDEREVPCTDCGNVECTCGDVGNFDDEWDDITEDVDGELTPEE